VDARPAEAFSVQLHSDDFVATRRNLRELRSRARIVRNQTHYQTDRAWRLRMRSLNAVLRARQLAPARRG
jgi:hypothetical protein